MGSLTYGCPSLEITFDDRVLAHLQIVMATKLRRGENFFFSWPEGSDIGAGRNAIWIDSSIPLYFRYSGSRHPEIDRDWLEQLAILASSSQGLDLADDTRLGSAPPHQAKIKA